MSSPMPMSSVAFSPQLDRSSLKALAAKPKAAAAAKPELMAACQSFEAVFISQLLRIMRQGEMKDKLFGGGMAEQIFREMLDDQLANEMAASGSMGIADMLYEQLEKVAQTRDVKAQVLGLRVIPDEGDDQNVGEHGLSVSSPSNGTDIRADQVMEATDDSTTGEIAP